ncbi:MAG: hypothetical protein ABI729_10315 [Chitinophagales bacterium]
MRIIEVDPYKVTLEFNTGELRIFDFEVLFKKHEKNPNSVVHKLKDKDIFRKVKLSEEYGTIYWEGISTMIDLDGTTKPAIYDPAPEVLYELSVPSFQERILH